MWARKLCGAPPGWPSRIKVIFFSFFSGTVGLSIYMYMAGSNISYLDLDKPTSESVLCLADWPLRNYDISWSNPEEVGHFFILSNPDFQHAARNQVCNVEGISGTLCRDVVLPVHEMKRPLALAMGDDRDGYDVLGIWARFFLLITFAIWAGVTIHDLALIGREQKDFILDVTGVNEHCPSIRRVWRFLAGYRLLVRLMTQERISLRVLGIVLAVVLAPLLLVWNLVVFNFVVCPLLLLAFCRYPIRMCRAWVFIVCCACSLYGLALTIQQIAFVATPHYRPRYAMTWQPDVGTLPGEPPCTCGCDYPVSFSVCVNLLIVGFVTTLKSFFLAFRCLKGLRRCQWANLLSVLFPVPVTLYSVDWRAPSGQPIRFRTEDMPVQGEVAFDPFALMDEQLESAFTTVHLRPAPVHRYHYSPSGELNLVPALRKMETPRIPSSLSSGEMQVRKVEYIGCCGFPWPTGGTQCVFEPGFVEKLDSNDDLEVQTPVVRSRPSSRVPSRTPSEKAPSEKASNTAEAALDREENEEEEEEEEAPPTSASSSAAPTTRTPSAEDLKLVRSESSDVGAAQEDQEPTRQPGDSCIPRPDSPTLLTLRRREVSSAVAGSATPASWVHCCHRPQIDAGAHYEVRAVASPRRRQPEEDDRDGKNHLYSL